MSEPYSPPVDLRSPFFTTPLDRKRFQLRLKCLLEMIAFWHVTETKKNDGPTFHHLFEQVYLRAVDHSQYVVDDAIRE